MERNTTEYKNVIDEKKLRNPDLKNYFPYSIFMDTTRKIKSYNAATMYCYDTLSEKMTNDLTERLKDTEFAQNGGEIHRVYLDVSARTYAHLRLEATQPLTKDAKLEFGRYAAEERNKSFRDELKKFNPDFEFTQMWYYRIDWDNWDGVDQVSGMKDPHEGIKGLEYVSYDTVNDIEHIHRVRNGNNIHIRDGKDVYYIDKKFIPVEEYDQALADEEAIRDNDKLRNPNIKDYYPYAVHLNMNKEVKGGTITNHCYDALSDRLTDIANEKLKNTEFAQNGGKIHRAYIDVMVGGSFSMLRFEATQPLSGEGKTALAHGVLNNMTAPILKEIRKFDSEVKLDNSSISVEWNPYDGVEYVKGMEKPDIDRGIRFDKDCMRSTSLKELLADAREDDVFIKDVRSHKESYINVPYEGYQWEFQSDRNISNADAEDFEVHANHQIAKQMREQMNMVLKDSQFYKDGGRIIDVDVHAMKPKDVWLSIDATGKLSSEDRNVLNTYMEQKAYDVINKTFQEVTHADLVKTEFECKPELASGNIIRIDGPSFDQQQNLSASAYDYSVWALDVVEGALRLQESTSPARIIPNFEHNKIDVKEASQFIDTIKQALVQCDTKLDDKDLIGLMFDEFGELTDDDLKDLIPDKNILQQ